MVFDLLYLDGRSLLAEPLEERRRLLAVRCAPDPRVRFSEHTDGDGLAAFAAAKERRLEGIMAKDRRTLPYPARAADWQKIKIRPEQELVVGGWTTGIGAATDWRRSSLASTRAARSGTPERSAPASRATSGPSSWSCCRRSRPTSHRSFRRLRAPPSRNAHWVRPELVIRAEFASWTSDGLVRQAAYKGLDRGKDPRAVHREVASSYPAMARNVQAP